MKRSEMSTILGQAILEAIPTENINELNIDTDHILKVVEEHMLPPCSKKGFYRWEDEDGSETI